MWIVREKIISANPVITNYEYRTLEIAEKHFNTLRHTWKRSYKPHPVKLFIIEYGTIIKTRSFEKDDDV